MDAKLFGATLASLRKKKGYTQTALAERLGLSNKTVSKWENGQGYPDIVHLTPLANLLDVTVDDLLSEKQRGITVAGTLIVDRVKNIDRFPPQGMLANILSVKRAVGGCAPNTATDLAVIDSTMPVSVIGCVGDDEDGRFLMSSLQKHGIDISDIRVLDNEQTSFCDVMSLPTGERTFFSCRGANAYFSPKDVDLSALSSHIFHIGYILLLDQFDAADKEYGTVMARFLHDLRERGIRTSVDVVSSSTGDYPEKILPVLPYTDYLIINEVEICNAWGENPRHADGTIDVDTICRVMKKTIARGVKEKVVIHAKEAGFCLSADGTFTKMGSLRIPAEMIAGSVGAGDAYCAGCLYAIYNGYTDEEMLKFASAAAACNLFAENSVDGMRSKKEIYKLMERYGRYPI